MNPRLVADAVLLLHAAFIAFVVFGAIGALRWRWWPLAHLPALGWGLWIEASGGICPLTTIEDAWRRRAGEAGLAASFVDTYVLPLIYPEGLTRPVQGLLAALALAINAGLYGWVLWRRARRLAVVSRR